MKSKIKFCLRTNEQCNLYTMSKWSNGAIVFFIDKNNCVYEMGELD